MLKVLIADDEPKIRRGLKNSIDWSELGIEVAGEAEDGEIALSLAKEIKPDILLVDICMPFLNGLEFISSLKGFLPDSIVIVITGHDEFAYAQQSIKLKVFDYLLKPVEKEHLYSVVSNAKDELIQLHQKNKYISWAEQQLKKNYPLLKERFLDEWIRGNIAGSEAEEQLEFFKLGLNQGSGMLIVRLAERYNSGDISREWDRQRILFAIHNIVDELVKACTPHVIFRDYRDNIIVLVPVADVSYWNELPGKISSMVEQYLKQVVIVAQQKMTGGILNAPDAYSKLAAEIAREENWTPVVMLAKSYIDANYSKEELTLQAVADEFKISPAYLSRLLRQEIGISFIDYLTQVRISKAMSLMEDPFIKMYEVAERVGYSSQHYFSTAFKRVTGISPAAYHKGGIR